LVYDVGLDEGRRGDFASVQQDMHPNSGEDVLCR
jgi:hypothetical protein